MSANVDGYRQEKVTLQDLFNGGKGKIREPSLKALRQRALDVFGQWRADSIFRPAAFRNQAPSCEKLYETWNNLAEHNKSFSGS